MSPEDIFVGIQKLEIVYIQLTKERENPQLIFESLNSTGLDLTQADLIRNYLLMGQAYSVQEDLYNRYWIKLEQMLPDIIISDFIRDYLTLKTGNIPNKDNVYSAFKNYYCAVVNDTIENFLDELTQYGEYYSWFKYANGPDDKINFRLLQLQKLRVFCFCVVLIHTSSEGVAKLPVESEWHKLFFMFNKALSFVVPGFVFLSGLKLTSCYQKKSFSFFTFPSLSPINSSILHSNNLHIATIFSVSG